MRALLLKDFYVILKQLGIILFMALILIILNSKQLTIFVALICATLPMTSMAYDKQCKWNALAIMMPYSKQQLVISKYMIGYICITVALMFAYLINIIYAMLGFGEFNFNVFNDLLILNLSFALIFISINNLIIFKFGVEKGRMVFICFMAIIGGFGRVINDALTSNDFSVFIKIVETPLLILLMAIVLNILSIVFAIRIKTKN